MVQGVTYKGQPYDVGVKLGGTVDRTLLLVKDFEDVRPPGMLRQACEAATGCPGYIIELDADTVWPSMYPLQRKGWYLYMPRPTPQGMPMYSWLRWQSVARGGIPMPATMLPSCKAP